MNDYERKQEARRQRLLARAERLKAEGEARIESGMSRLREIPFGQPILVGHHSERRDRNYRARAGRSIDKGMELTKAAKEVEARAFGVGHGGVSSDDPDAVAKLQAELSELKATQEKMVKINRLVRARDRDGLAAMGLSSALIEELFTPDCVGRIGFPDYKLKNNGANIRRIEKRIALLSTYDQRETTERTAAGGVRVVENAEENRLQLIFPSKPDSAVRSMLKSHGFRWAPSNGAWQRHLNNGARFAAECVLRALAPAPEAAP